MLALGVSEISANCVICHDDFNGVGRLAQTLSHTYINQVNEQMRDGIHCVPAQKSGSRMPPTIL